MLYTRNAFLFRKFYKEEVAREQVELILILFARYTQTKVVEKRDLRNSKMEKEKIWGNF